MVQQATLGQQPHATGTSPDDLAAVPNDVALSLLHSARPQVDIVIPVYNEEADLAPSVTRLHRYLSAELPFSFRITVADNASTDRTWAIARTLEDELDGVVAVHLDQKGRGRALRHVWSRSDAAVLAYMDVDLSTDLAAVLPLVAPLVSGHSDMAIGTRLAQGSRVVRGTKREVISRCYNLLLRATLATGFSDAQCGFKAIRADRARALLPLVKDTGWFFDTELLFLAERAGMRIHEVPVDWVDDPDSRVDLVATARDDLKGVARLVRGLATGTLPLAALRQSTAAEEALQAPPGLIAQLLRFSAVGVVSTAAYVVLYVLLRSVMPALGANALALLVTAVVNTAVNRRVTFGVRNRRARLRHQLQGIVVFAVGLALSSGALAMLHGIAPRAGRGIEIAVLVSAGVAATVVRFALFRSWVFPGADRVRRIVSVPNQSIPDLPTPTLPTITLPSPTSRSER
jgi:putative flippase GtrA